MTPGGDGSSLMVRDCTKRTAAETAAVGYEGELDRFVDRNQFMVGWVLPAGKQEFVYVVQFFGCYGRM